MSKSLGNFFTVREAAGAYGYDSIRMFMLMSHYRSPLNYSGEILVQAKNALERLSRDSQEDHWTIMEVLTAYVRDNAPWPPKRACPTSPP